MPATEPEQIHGMFEQAFTAGDIEALMALYEPDAALVPQPERSWKGRPLSALRWLLDRGARSRSRPSSSCASMISPTSRTVGAHHQIERYPLSTRPAHKGG